MFKIFFNKKVHIAWMDLEFTMMEALYPAGWVVANLQFGTPNLYVLGQERKKRVHEASG